MATRCRVELESHAGSLRTTAGSSSFNERDDATLTYDLKIPHEY